jgi:hypothetical protein
MGGVLAEKHLLRQRYFRAVVRTLMHDSFSRQLNCPFERESLPRLA